MTLAGHTYPIFIAFFSYRYVTFFTCFFDGHGFNYHLETLVQRHIKTKICKNILQVHMIGRG